MVPVDLSDVKIALAAGAWKVLTHIADYYNNVAQLLNMGQKARCQVLTKWSSVIRGKVAAIGTQNSQLSVEVKLEHLFEWARGRKRGHWEGSSIKNITSERAVEA